MTGKLRLSSGIFHVKSKDCHFPEPRDTIDGKKVKQKQACLIHTSAVAVLRSHCPSFPVDGTLLGSYSFTPGYSPGSSVIS